MSAAVDVSQVKTTRELIGITGVKKGSVRIEKIKVFFEFEKEEGRVGVINIIQRDHDLSGNSTPDPVTAGIDALAKIVERELLKLRRADR